jgi:hypothetical protein
MRVMAWAMARSSTEEVRPSDIEKHLETIASRLQRSKVDDVNYSGRSATIVPAGR